MSRMHSTDFHELMEVEGSTFVWSALASAWQICVSGVGFHVNSMLSLLFTPLLLQEHACNARNKCDRRAVESRFQFFVPAVFF
mmetsp:Transcript_46177/g.122401  ORF Transcript_46177/g.122401 Transcript_46177/m.122401 type:complete len:83 (+) Transcript_46177:332-580(+)